VPSTRASKRSISGAERPTKDPSECFGPGCGSPGQVHADKRWPGSNDYTEKDGEAVSWSGIGKIENTRARVGYCVRDHHFQGPRGEFEFQGRPDTEACRHRKSRTSRATKSWSERVPNTERGNYQAVDGSTVPSTAFLFERYD
jgi:hypothetical protein